MPEEFISSVLGSLSRRKVHRLIIVFRNTYSWYGLYDFIMRRIFRRTGIDDIYPWSLRHLGPWRLLTRGKLKNLIRTQGFTVLKTYGLFCLPFYKLVESETIKNNPLCYKLSRVINAFSGLLESILHLCSIDKFMGEQIVFICQKHGKERN